MSVERTGFFITGGTLSKDAPSYVERRADGDLLDGLVQGDFCYVLTSRQMGKSSLMVRTASRLREHGVRVVALDLTAVGRNLTPEQWYDGLLMRVGQQVGLEEELERFWRANEQLGPCQRLFAALRDVLMTARSGPVAIFVDEIDSVRCLPFSTDEFFAAIRECYNRRAQDAAFQRLTFCLLGVATPSDLIRDTRTTPFNVGRRIELHDFTEAEAAPLAEGLKHMAGQWKSGSADGATQMLRHILQWTGGHPYLTQRFCHAIAGDERVVDEAGVDQLCEELFLSHRARERDDNLLFVRELLLRSDVDLVSLLELYGKVRRGERVADDPTSPLVSVLRLAGIVACDAGRLRERNRVYSRVFDPAWIRAHMPDAEMRRQRAAFRRGVIRTTAIAAVVIAALAVAVVVALNQASKARRALAQSYASQARALRVSGLGGQRFDSLDALEKARRYHTNAQGLRDEALACLALMDVREITLGPGRWEKTPWMELGSNLDVAAMAAEDGTITLRSMREEKPLASLPGAGWPIGQLRFGRRDSVLVAQYGGSAQHRLVAWDWRAGRQLFAREYESSGAAMDFSADGRKLVVGRSDGNVAVLSLPEGEVLQTLGMKLDSGASRVPQAIRIHPSGDLLAASSPDDHYVEIWDLRTRQRRERPYHAGVIHDMAWHPQGRMLAAACGDARVYLWHTNDFENPRKLTGHEGGVVAVAFNGRGTLLASLGSDETVRLWIPPTARQVVSGVAGGDFHRLQFSNDDRHLIAAGPGLSRNHVWEVAGDDLTVLQVQIDPGDRIRAIDFSLDNRWLLAVSAKQITLWEASSGRALGTIPMANPQAAWFAADSQHLVVSGDSGFFRWPLLYQEDVLPPRLQCGAAQQLPWVTDELGMMALSLDRATAAVIRKSEVLLVPLNSTNGAGLRTNHLGAYCSSLALHPQARWLATQADEAEVLHLWNLARPRGAAPPVTVLSSAHFVFSPDGEWLAVCAAGEFRFYRVGEWGQPAFRVGRTSPSDQRAPVAFSRVGRLAALAPSRYSIQLHKLPESGVGTTDLIGTLQGPDRVPLEILAFSADGRRLAAATDGQTIQLWNLALLREGLALLNLHQNWPEP